MAIAIRGTTPGTVGTNSNPISLLLDGTRQPATNDVLLIIHGNDYYNLSNMPTPTVAGSTSGVVAVTGGTADAGDPHAHAKAYTYVVGSTGDLTVAVTETGSADEEKVLAVYVLIGADTTTPIDVAGNATGGATNHDAPSISPTSSDAFLICHANGGDGTGGDPYTHPSGMTETYDIDVGGFMPVGGAVLQLSASGATGTKTFVASLAVNFAALSIAVNTSAGAPPPELEAGPVVNVTRSSNRFA